jgi:hypothetical protein
VGQPPRGPPSLFDMGMTSTPCHTQEEENLGHNE